MPLWKTDASGRRLGRDTNTGHSSVRARDVSRAMLDLRTSGRQVAFCHRLLLCLSLALFPGVYTQAAGGATAPTLARHRVEKA